MCACVCACVCGVRSCGKEEGARVRRRRRLCRLQGEHGDVEADGRRGEDGEEDNEEVGHVYPVDPEDAAAQLKHPAMRMRRERKSARGSGKGSGNARVCVGGERTEQRYYWKCEEMMGRNKGNIKKKGKAPK